MDERPKALERLNPLVGTWQTTATNHRMAPEMTANGEVCFEWLPGEMQLTMRTGAEPPYPSSLAVIGVDESGDAFYYHYYDSRGVHRVYTMDLRDGVWTISRDGQRFVGRIAEDGQRIDGEWQWATDGGPLEHDFDLACRKIG